MEVNNFETPTELEHEGWRQAASCRDEGPELFYGPGGYERKEDRLERERLAKKVCDGCQVKYECLVEANSRPDEHGIWGGLNEIERRSLIRVRTNI